MGTIPVTEVPCYGLTDLFFDGPKAQAVQICRTCNWRLDCLEIGLAQDQPGMFGGASQRARRRIRGARAAGEVGPDELEIVAEFNRMQQSTVA